MKILLLILIIVLSIFVLTILVLWWKMYRAQKKFKRKITDASIAAGKMVLNQIQKEINESKS